MTKTYLQIQKQIAQLQSEADALRKKEAAGVLERIKEAIAVYGFTAQELGVAATRGRQATAGKSGPVAVRGRKAKAGAPKKSSVAKYRDDQGNHWSGRGPRPAWFKAALAAGKTPAELAAG